MRACLTGGIACGKSLLSQYLIESGVDVVDADDVVHSIIPDEERKRLAKIVFGDAGARRALEAKVHPVVRERIDAFFSAPGDGLRLAVVPLLFECGWEGSFDVIGCIASSRETQISRMMASRGYSREEAEARIAAQMPVEEKAARADFIIRNDATPADLRMEAKRFLDFLMRRRRDFQKTGIENV